MGGSGYLIGMLLSGLFVLWILTQLGSVRIGAASDRRRRSDGAGMRQAADKHRDAPKGKGASQTPPKRAGSKG